MNKILTYFCLIFIVTLATSCSKDDAKINSIQGTWLLTSWNLKTPIDLDNDGILSTTFTPGCLNGSELIFNDNSSGTLFFSSSVSYNTTIENGTLVYLTSCVTDTDLSPSPITYIQDGETLIITSTNNEYALTINGTTLAMTVPNGFTATDVDSFEITAFQDITYIFTKQ